MVLRIIDAHCLNKTVTQRKWLPQIKVDVDQGAKPPAGSSVGAGSSLAAERPYDEYRAQRRSICWQGQSAMVAVTLSKTPLSFRRSGTLVGRK